MTVYSLNLRVFWPLVTCACMALLCLLQALRSKAGAAAASPWDYGPAAPLLKASLLLLLLAYLALRYRGWRGGRATRSPGFAVSPEGAWSQLRRRQRRRSLLEKFYEQQLRLSPHVLGHSKAHVSQVVGEVVRAGKAPDRLALRGDFVQVGSAYEQHKVRSPDCFDVLVPLRLPPRLELRVQPRQEAEVGLLGAFACALEVLPGGAHDEAGGRRGNSISPRETGALSEALCVELPSQQGGGRHLSSVLVLRWFQGQVQRCLGAVRSRLQERCRVSLAVGPGRPLALHIEPRLDYVCCHLSMAVRLIPAIPLGEALYLTPLPSARPPAPGKLGTFWTLNVSKQEQRLLGFFKEQAPTDSCHLKCLQILKGLRDVGGRSLEQPLGAQWNRVLSSYVLKTALLWLLLRGPLQAWEDRFLVDRLENLFLFLVESLQRRKLLHLFLGNPQLPEALSLPKVLKEAAPVNLLADFDGTTLDKVAVQLLNTWKQVPKVVRMYSGHRYRRKHPV
ncbi:inositol 1,4,5-trisphosphate receptor-interacting protein-like 2 [Rhineura floridana]|uniref:inositol 1,4,5-trisphosphate receptor-interacting protein-like 2 n=1 Tax=Rhineura floridana TaxID=261503 RepID=UPI002AC81AC1|nr:inositol 1,4,5-trisphosphate receptor-interacting protein-like 2 [Rhineura floridana]